MVELAGRVALVTGAARGLGLHVAAELARAGMKIAGLDTRKEELEAALEDLQNRYGVATLPLPASVASEQDVISAVDQTVVTFGRIHALVNNAGIRMVAPVWETDTETWDGMMAVNLRGEFLCTREVLRQSMLERDEGRLIFISSIAGRRGAPHSCAYSATKWGILGLAHSTAQDLKDTSIRVTAITPGRIETPMAHESEQWDPERGWLDPDAVARAVAFCLSQDPDTIIPEFHLHHQAEL
ncbi:MAG: SDR family oxidoreductase [Gammaproteobacteria bacterium]|nr:SDR family NAD(P)-dependent oxidoreductase [Gammaproteobacteria bacterium]MYH69119.1 SDR family oxidoreductase [Gammaproteobacteria bacterium]